MPSQEVIRGNQRSSSVLIISAHQRSSEGIRGHQRQSEVLISAHHQCSSAVIRGHQRQSEVLISAHHQCSSSVLISGHQRSSESIRGSQQRLSGGSSPADRRGTVPSPSSYCVTQGSSFIFLGHGSVYRKEVWVGLPAKAQSDAIRCNQWSSVVISGHQWSSRSGWACRSPCSTRRGLAAHARYRGAQGRLRTPPPSRSSRPWANT